MVCQTLPPLLLCFLSLFYVYVAISLWRWVWSFYRALSSFVLFQLYKVNTNNKTQNKCGQGSLILGDLIFLTILSILCCSWVLWNSEVRHHLYRKTAASYLAVFKQKNTRVGIMYPGSITSLAVDNVFVTYSGK